MAVSLVYYEVGEARNARRPMRPIESYSIRSNRRRPSRLSELSRDQNVKVHSEKAVSAATLVDKRRSIDTFILRGSRAPLFSALGDRSIAKLCFSFSPELLAERCS